MSLRLAQYQKAVHHQSLNVVAIEIVTGEEIISLEAGPGVSLTLMMGWLALRPVNLATSG